LGIIFDTSVIIAGERGEASVPEFIRHLTQVYGDDVGAVSSISVVELTHGLYRAKSPGNFSRRQRFSDDLFKSLAVVPLTREIAFLAGRTQGEQAANGVSIDLGDLLIGSTAIFMGYSLATLNEKHFAQIPGLTIAASSRS
jgi:tRNA(fMet)-specific endonuclease VapC